MRRLRIDFVACLSIVTQHRGIAEGNEEIIGISFDDSHFALMLLIMIEMVNRKPL